MIGLQQRCNHEHADAAWVVSVHASDAEARAAEHLLSIRYGLPTIPVRRADVAATASSATRR